MQETFTPPPFEQSALPVPPQAEAFDLPNPEALNARAEVIFSPYAPDALGGGAKSPEGEQNYDFLFSDEDLTQKKVEDAAVRSPEGRGVVTPSSMEYSAAILKRFDSEPQLDAKIKQIIGKHNGSNELGSKNTITAIRENKPLRVELGSYFLSKLEAMHDALPDRVKKNGQKSSDTPGYRDIPGLRSREYASLLALAQLDGTFDPDKVQEGDTTRIDENGNVIDGQHRAATDMLLFW